MPPGGRGLARPAANTRGGAAGASTRLSFYDDDDRPRDRAVFTAPARSAAASDVPAARTQPEWGSAGIRTGAYSPPGKGARAPPSGSADRPATRERENADFPQEPLKFRAAARTGAATERNDRVTADSRRDERLDSPEEDVSLFFIVQQLACSENALFNILDGLKANASHVSFFCREFFATADAALSIERLPCNERLQRQMHQACVLEFLALGVAAQLSSGSLDNVTMAVRSRLRNLLYYLHENCLVMLDFVFQRWSAENTTQVPLNVEILLRVRRYRRLRRGEHIMALRQHNEIDRTSVV